MTEEARDRYEVDLAAVWPMVRREFNYPLVKRARLSDDPVGSGDAYRWSDDEVVLSKPFLDRLAETDHDRRTTIEMLLKHEVGHYVLFPRELVHHLRYLQRATETFGEDDGSGYYSLYADVCVDLRLLRGGYVWTDLLNLRERALEAASTARSDVEETVQRRVHRLMLGIYQESFEDLPRRISLADVERDWLDPFLDINYFADDPATHERNVVRFGNALERVLADVPDHGTAALNSPLDEGKDAADRPFGGSDPAVIPDARLDEALTDAVEDGGSFQYERLRDFLESRADFEDPLDSATRERSGGAGIEPGSFERYDDVIPFYRRWARSFPLYVTDAEVPADDEALYRHGRRPFESGDPIHDVDPFVSFGVLGVPGVTKVNSYTESDEHQTRREVPDLLVGIDSSASMPHPTEDSHAVLAAFLLAATYRQNGARVGGYNFSTEVAFLPPTDDLSAYHSLVCGYWGGGTAFDRAALAEFLADVDRFDGLTFSTTEAYERLLAEIDESADVKESDAALFGDRQSLDHAIITDGNLINRSSLVAAINDTPTHVRTFLFVTDADEAADWRDSDVDAWVYSVPDAAALSNRILGLAAHRLSTE